MYFLCLKKIDVVDFETLCLTARLIQIFCVNYKINRSYSNISNDQISHIKMDNI